MDKTREPSGLFETVVRQAGSLVAHCELCGRTHFATLEEGPFDEGELEGLRAKAKADPDKYVEDSSYDSIAWGMIGGKQAVIGCPCNRLREFEDLIWGSRRKILEYLERRTLENLEDATQDAASVQRTKSSVERADPGL